MIKRMGTAVVATAIAVVVLALAAPAGAAVTPGVGGGAPEGTTRGEAVIKCWKPGYTTPITLVRKGVSYTAVGYVAKSYGCTMWTLLRYSTETPDTAAAGPCTLYGNDGARAMGFKPERGDCA